jgi:CRISPR associated protein
VEEKEMIDHIIPKPKQISGYSTHRMVADLLDGAPGLFVDNGDHLVIRSDKKITEFGKAVKTPALGSIIGFELKACAAQRKGGKNIYPEIGDWRTRRSWLETEGKKNGFEILALHVSGSRQIIISNGGRKFWIDSTLFTGILKVVDQKNFNLALVKGVGRVGKAFGMGLLVI